MLTISQLPHRAVVEHLVRQAVYQRLGKPLPVLATGPNPLVVNVSARASLLTLAARNGRRDNGMNTGAFDRRRHITRLQSIN